MAARLLARHPEIARDSIHTAVAAHDVEAVAQFLAKDPTLVNQPAKLDGWTPLLRLAYTRIPIAALSEHAVVIATMLLDHGAAPNAAWSDGENQFTVLTGVMGGGEGQQAARTHPQAEALARLLIARARSRSIYRGSTTHRWVRTPPSGWTCSGLHRMRAAKPASGRRHEAVTQNNSARSTIC
jgi:hypothetical protein